MAHTHSLLELWQAQHPNQALPTQKLLALDPGETTGMAVFDGLCLIHTEQLGTGDMQWAPGVIDKAFRDFSPTIVVMEDYRVYAWRARAHTWNPLHTPRLIGAIETLCQIHKIPYLKQSAQVAKGFATNERLEGMGLWVPGQRHAADAVRHAVYWLLFGKEPLNANRV